MNIYSNLNQGLKICDNIGLSQKLALTPQVLQMLNILQMNASELDSFLEQQYLENPVIEITSNDEELNEYDNSARKLDWLNSMDKENQVYYDSQQFNERNEQYNEIIEYNMPDTLYNHLISQLSLLQLNHEEKRSTRFIVYSLNEDGYLETSIEEIADILRISRQEAMHSLRIVQSLEPQGVGASDLIECLTIQLKKIKIDDKAVYLMVNHYIDQLAKNKFGMISRETGIDIEEIKRIYSIIKTLNPHPGNSFSSQCVDNYLRPDIIVIKFEDYFDIQLSYHCLPKINISSHYIQMLQDISDPGTKIYIKKKMEDVAWIISCIEQRNNTLLKISRAIVEFQKDFFNKGPGYLKVMALKDISAKLAIHESTVSRAIHGKSLQCTWGVFFLKNFFSKRCGQSNDSFVNSRSVKLLITEIINNEDRKKPFSDDKISDLLNKKDIKISRRTIAKYRNEMNVPGTSMRKDV